MYYSPTVYSFLLRNKGVVNGFTKKIVLDLYVDKTFRKFIIKLFSLSPEWYQEKIKLRIKAEKDNVILTILFENDLFSKRELIVSKDKWNKCFVSNKGGNNSFEKFLKSVKMYQQAEKKGF